MKVFLHGGVRDGEEMEIPEYLTVLEVPKATPRQGIDVRYKRHSWDDDALVIETGRYGRTDRLVNDAVVFEPL
jgi:hypothetical protein